MKKGLLFLFTVVFIFNGYTQRVKVHGQLHVEGVALKDAKGDTLTLRGMSFGWHNFWPRFYTAGAVKWLSKDWNCSVIRAAMGIEPKEGYKEKPEWSKEKIRTVVDAAIQEDVYVIIDWHSHNINLPEAKSFFTEMATLYGKNPHVIYEIFNEPDQESWQEVKAYSVELVKTIRAIDPDNLILVGTPHWDQDVHLAADDPITGFDNIMYTLHFYAATHKRELRDRADYALKKGLPLFISESAGMEATGDGPLNEEEWNKWIQWAEERNISWVTWSVSDKDETCSVLQKTASADGNWKAEDLKPSGVKSRALIKKYNSK
ncbi:MAG TPA: glycoside hydrolase family 5 protein [Flavisolibacter sp.]|nr:glycoside hydrolase family 5 protein [Flavisolibacter sp.]